MTQRQNFDRNRRTYDKVMQLMLGVMAIFYIGLGFLVMQKNWLMIDLEPNVAKALGVLLIVYGVYRGYRAVQNYREMS